MIIHCSALWLIIMHRNVCYLHCYKINCIKPQYITPDLIRMYTAHWTVHNHLLCESAHLMLTHLDALACQKDRKDEVKRPKEPPTQILGPEASSSSKLFHRQPSYVSWLWISQPSWIGYSALHWLESQRNKPDSHFISAFLVFICISLYIFVWQTDGETDQIRATP